MLALDISSSVSSYEDRLQREGLAAALASQEVIDAILGGPGHVALAVYEWSGRYQQDTVIDWRALDSPAAILETSELIKNSSRSYAEFPTALGFAISHALILFKEAPLCDAYTLDVSGDGINNDGYSPAEVHKNHRFSGKTVNALAIGGASAVRADDAKLIEHYRDELIYGPGAFVEVAQDFEDFARAIKKKLIREVQVLQLTGPEKTLRTQ